MAEKLKFGIITDCKAGLTLAARFQEKHSAVSVCGYSNSSSAAVKDLYKEYSAMMGNKGAEMLFDVDALMLSLDSPRIILLVCRSFERDDIKLVSDKLSKGDIIIDCCDMSFKESAMYGKQFARQDINYLGTGFVYTTESLISSPSFMISGNRTIYDRVKPIFADVAPYVNGFNCAAYIGPDGSGQFVKMVYSGIYYTFMELISEIIFLLNTAAGVDPITISDILTDYNSGEAASFLLDAACDVVKRRDSATGRFLMDVTLDRIPYTEKDIWIGRSAYELACPMPTVNASIDMRFYSENISRRISASRLVDDPDFTKVIPSARKSFIETCRKALYLGMVCCLDQSFLLLRKASEKYGWNLNLSKIAACYYGGTFAQSNILLRAMKALENANMGDNIMLSEHFSSLVKEYSTDVRELICGIINCGWPLEALKSVLTYIDSLRCRRLPTPTVQMMRDCISETGFERIDDSGIFYGNWIESEEVDSSKR